jgi:DNA-binding transcriptional ArsR family regulator
MAHADPFQTLADPSRRRVVEALLAGEQAVNDLVAAVGQQQPGVSRHLRILLEAGFVQVRPEGQRRLYSLRPEPFREVDAWLARYRALWEARLDRFALALEQRRAPLPGPLPALARAPPKANKSRARATAARQQAPRQQPSRQQASRRPPAAKEQRR